MEARSEILQFEFQHQAVQQHLEKFLGYVIFLLTEADK